MNPDTPTTQKQKRHISRRIRAPRKRLAIDKTIDNVGSLFYNPPLEMFRVPLEREEPIVMMTWNQFIAVLWQFVEDYEGKS